MMETQDSYGEIADLEGAQGTGRKTEHWKQDRNYKTQTKCFFCDQNRNMALSQHSIEN